MGHLPAGILLGNLWGYGKLMRDIWKHTEKTYRNIWDSVEIDQLGSMDKFIPPTSCGNFIGHLTCPHMGVSINGDTPKWLVYKGKSF